MKAILFDLQGTVLENGVFPSPIKQVRQLLHVRMPFSDFVMRFERVFMTQSFSTLRDAFIAVCHEFEIQPKEYIIEKLVGVWNTNKLMSKLYPDSLDGLQELRKDYKVVIFANIDCFTKEVVEKFNLQNYADSIVLSCYTGFTKSDDEFFMTPLELLGVDKKDAILVGDSLESDITAAARIGIASVLIDRQGRREFDRKIASLVEVKKFL